MLQRGLALPCVLASRATGEVLPPRTTLFPPEMGRSLLRLTQGKGRCCGSKGEMWLSLTDAALPAAMGRMGSYGNICVAPTNG